MPNTTTEPGPKPNFMIRHYSITLSFAFLAVGLVPQLLILKHPQSIGLPAKIVLVCALAVIYMAGFFFARKQATATPPTASPVKRLVYRSLIAFCLAYSTVASSEFLKTLQRCDILAVHARSEFVITVGRREMALLFLLVAMALALCISGASAAVAAPSLQSTIHHPRPSHAQLAWLTSVACSRPPFRHPTRCRYRSLGPARTHQAASAQRLHPASPCSEV